MRKSLEIRQAIGKAVDEAKPFVGKAEYAEKRAAITALEAELKDTMDMEALDASGARPMGDDTAVVAEEILSADDGLFASGARSMRRGWSQDDYLRNAASLCRQVGVALPPKDKAFRSFGEQLQAVARYALTSHSGSQVVDPRLVRAPTGASEVDPTGGGFLVQVDFATAVFTRAYDMGQILGEVDKMSISTGANGIKIPAVDETSRATGSRYGGVQSYWVGEGGTATPAKPKFRHIDLSLNKLLANWYVTDELLQDQSILQSIATKAFSEEIVFMTEDAIFEGDGAAKPKGILTSPALVTVSKENGQKAATLVYENLLNMYSRMWARSRGNAKWYINQDIEPQLFALNQVIGVGGVPVYLPPGGLSSAPYASLFGRPVAPTEYSSTVGTLGDIILADFSQYVLADKGGVQAAQSMHVAFLTDEMVFRITYRVDGQTIWNAPLTPFKGSATKSPFIALATRA